MTHDAAPTIKKLQEDIHTMQDLRTTILTIRGLENIKEDVASLRESISLNHVTLQQELSRLGGKDRAEVDAAIATWKLT